MLSTTHMNVFTAQSQASPFWVSPEPEEETPLSYSQTLAWLTETHTHSLMPTAIPGNSSKCTIKSQQLFQIPAKKTAPAAASSELRNEASQLVLS